MEVKVGENRDGFVEVKDRDGKKILAEMNIELLNPQCGACCNCGPGSSTKKEEVTISSINRNFPGRSGPGSVWLASPKTVVASAIAGKYDKRSPLQDRQSCKRPCNM